MNGKKFEEIFIRDTIFACSMVANVNGKKKLIIEPEKLIKKLNENSGNTKLTEYNISVKLPSKDMLLSKYL